MRLFLHLALLLWGFALLTATAARADTSTRLPQLNVIALGQGQVLEAAPPHQLSLNAHVREFAYQSGSLEIAYAGSNTDGDTTTQFVKLVGVRHSTTLTLIAQTGLAIKDTSATEPFSLIGWSADGRYLVVQHIEITRTDSNGEGVYGDRLTCIDVGASPIQTREIASPAAVPFDAEGFTTRAIWSPSHTRLLLMQAIVLHSPQPVVRVAALYDFARDRVDILPVTAPLRVAGWVDDTRLRLADGTKGQTLLEFNAQTMKTEPLAAHSALSAPRPFLAPTNTNLILDTQPQTLTDTQRVAQTSARVLWVRRTRGPKALSTLAVDVIGGTDDPQAQWAQTGQQIAYLAHGDLFVADLPTRDATLKEKYFVGDKLTCPEERQLAMGELRNIGLAALQYTQDYDENYPPQAGINDTLAPYLQPDTLLQIGSAKFVYHAPIDLALSKMDAPADTVLGTMDLPCAQIVLYADGHVKSLPKTITSP